MRLNHANEWTRVAGCLELRQSLVSNSIATTPGVHKSPLVPPSLYGGTERIVAQPINALEKTPRAFDGN